ncbi:DinB family protein [Psychroserpens damuponensis]|uniref:DinB family protein n=1 Tax=Psychroserpens damuponensis TaxID=943936 RepID=UPI00058B9CBB|nr:DinB family protein [Psychroserpens damuponensis]
MNSDKINSLITTLEAEIAHYKISNPEVSKSNVAWHIDHSLKVINKVCETLQKSEPETYKNNFSFLGKVFFFLGFFPRGKAKAPKHVIPPETILKADLISQIELAKANIKTLSNLDKNAYFKHPLFGNVNTPRIYRFLELHTNHHVKIIGEIVGN